MKTGLPGYQEKQKILYIEKSSGEVLIDYGDTLISANRIFYALEFYEKAKHRSGLEEIMKVAASFGESVLFVTVAKTLGNLPSPEEWD